MIKRIIKYIVILIIICSVSVYAYFHFTTEEPSVFTYQKQVDMPIDRVFPSFENLQIFNSWNAFFPYSEYPSSVYYSPYEGVGAAATLSSKNKKEQLEITIKKSKYNQYLQYQIIDPHNKKPIILDIKFKPLGKITQLNYRITVPPNKVIFDKDLFESQEDFNKKANLSTDKLKQLIEKKVNRESTLEKVQFDSIQVEQIAPSQYIGISASTKNKPDEWVKNLIQSYTKLENFTSVELGLNKDDIGYTSLFTSPTSQMKEQQYFMATSINHTPKITDANFSMQNKPASYAYVAYYKGNWEGRQKIQKQLVQRTEKEGKNIIYFSITLLEKPKKDQPFLIKMALAYE